jgi:hypothetical protein
VFGALLLRKRITAPAEATFDVVARGRVEPLGNAPTTVPGATFAPTAVARVEPIGEIPPVPQAPTNNSVVVDDDEIDQSWSFFFVDGTPVEQMRVQQATNSGFSQNLAEQTVTPAAPTGSATWANQADGVTRYYRVRAENGSGNSPWSNTASVVHPSEVPGVPQNLNNGTRTPSSIQLTWGAPATGGPVTLYRVERFEGGEDTTTGLSLTWSGLDEGAAYAFRVRAEGPGGVGEYTSHIVRATANATPGLGGCEDQPDPEKQIFVFRLLITDNASENTAIKVFRNGNLYDTIGPGTQTYTPAPQSGSWRVVASGGLIGHVLLGGGSANVPDSANSPTRTMPFSGPCEET